MEKIISPLNLPVLSYFFAIGNKAIFITKEKSSFNSINFRDRTDTDPDHYP
mgnify:FL=1